MKKRSFPPRKGPAHPQAAPGSRPTKSFRAPRDADAQDRPQRRPFHAARDDDAQEKPQRRPFRGMGSTSRTGTFNPRLRRDGGEAPQGRFPSEGNRSRTPQKGAAPQRSRFADDSAPRKPFRKGTATRPAFAGKSDIPPTFVDRTAPARSVPEIRLPYIYGLHAASAAWRNPRRTCRRLLITENALSSFRAPLQEAEQGGFARPSLEIVDKDVLDTLLPKGSVHQGVLLEVEPLPETDVAALCRKLDAETAATVMVLDQVTDPHNIGAILRSCAVFGAKALIVSRHNAPEISALIAKTATGAVEHVPVIRVANITRALEDLAEGGFWRVGLDEHAEKPLAETPLSGKVALVMGSEGSGMRKLTRENCDHIALLPAAGPLMSLNVSNAAAIALYEVQRQK